MLDRSVCKKRDQKIGGVAASKQSLHPAYEGLAERSSQIPVFPRDILLASHNSGFNMKISAEHLVV